MSRIQPAHASSRFGGATLVLAVVAAVAFAYRGLPSLGFVDVDTYSLIATGRIDTLERLWAVWTEPLMQGQMPNALFWRPLTSMSWGLDHALWHDRAFGYHLTDLALHLCACWLLYRVVLGLRVSGIATDGEPPTRGVSSDPSSRRIAAIATLAFAVHPIGYEVVPAIARRADLWLAVFALAVLRSMQRTIAGERCGWVTFALALAGMLAKVSAVLYLPLALLLVWVSTASWRRVWLCLPIVWAIAAGLLARWFALDGTIGGYSEGRELSLPGVTARSLETLAGTMWMPGQLEWLSEVPTVPLLAATIAVLLIAARLAFTPAPDDAAAWSRAWTRCALGSIVICFAIYPAARTVAAPRGMYLLTAFVCVLVAVWLSDAYGVLRRRTVRGQPALRVGLGAIAAIAVTSIGVGAVSGRAIASWHDNAAHIARALHATRDAIDGLDSATLLLVNYTTYVRPRRPLERPVILEHSVQGWLDLHYPAGAFEAIGLTHTTVLDPALEPLRHADVRYAPAPPIVEIDIGDGALLTTHPWDVAHRTRRSWDPERVERRAGGLTLHLADSALAAATPPAFFLIWNGETVTRRSVHVPWRVAK